MRELTKNQNNLTRGIMFMLLAMCLFTVLNAVIKEAISAYHPVQITFFRCLFAVFPASLLLMMRKKKTLSLPTSWGIHLKRGVLLAICYPLLYIGIIHLSLSTSTALYFTATFFIVMLSYPMLKERVLLRQWMAVIFGFLGVLVIVQPGSDAFQWATLCVIIGALTESVFNLYGRILSATHDTVVLTALGSLLPAIILLPFLPYIWTTPDLGGWLAFLALGLIGGVGQLCVTHAYSLAPAGTLAPMIYSAIIWSGLCDVLLYGIWPSLSLLLGCGIIIGSGILVTYKRKLI